MELDITARGSGKTYRLVHWVLEGEGRYIVVADASRADWVFHQYWEEGLTRSHILTPYDFAHHKYRGRHPNPQLAIDDAIDVLQALAVGAQVARISFSPYPMNVENP